MQLNKSKLINTLYAIPATALFIYSSVKIIQNSLNFPEIGYLNNFPLYVILGISFIAIFCLWVLVINPASIENLKDRNKELFGFAIFFGVLFCGLFYIVNIQLMVMSLFIGYPPREESIWSITQALICLGPLRIVTNSYYNWSEIKFITWLLLISSFWLFLLWLFTFTVGKVG